MPRVGEVLWDVLVDWGVTHVFGIPGDSIDPLLDDLRKDTRLTFITVRHEEAGAFMASAYAKKTGRLGVCMGTAGPGAIHLINGLYDAKMDHAPVLAITGQVSLGWIGTDYFQEVNILRVFDDVARYNYQVSDPRQIDVLASMACRTALAEHGVAHLSFPFEVSAMKTTGHVRRFSVVPHAIDAIPTTASLEAAARRINAAQKPVVLAGRGARPFRSAVLRLVEKSAIPVVNTLPAKGVIPDAHPLALGGLGLLGAKPAHRAMETCDLCLLVGTSYPYLEFLPKHATMLQIDWEASQIGKRRAVDVGLVGSAEPTLNALADLLVARDPSSFVTDLQQERQHWLEAVAEQARRRVKPNHPMHPQWVAERLSHLVDDDANVAVDVGNSLVWMARNFKIRDQGWLVSAWLGSMGFGLPAAMAAKIAEPARQSIAVVGDGAFTMLMGDFVTAIRYRWPITVVVLNNSRLGMIKFEQEVHGMPEFGTGLTNPNFAQYAEAAGGQGFRVTHPDQLDDALTQALHAKVATIVDVLTDPDEKPLPPRITASQAVGYMQALFKETFP